MPQGYTRINGWQFFISAQLTNSLTSYTRSLIVVFKKLHQPKDDRLIPESHQGHNGPKIT